MKSSRDIPIRSEPTYTIESSDSTAGPWSTATNYSLGAAVNGLQEMTITNIATNAIVKIKAR